MKFKRSIWKFDQSLYKGLQFEASNIQKKLLRLLIFKHLLTLLTNQPFFEYQTPPPSTHNHWCCHQLYLLDTSFHSILKTSSNTRRMPRNIPLYQATLLQQFIIYCTGAFDFIFISRTLNTTKKLGKIFRYTGFHCKMLFEAQTPKKLFLILNCCIKTVTKNFPQMILLLLKKSAEVKRNFNQYCLAFQLYIFYNL